MNKSEFKKKLYELFMREVDDLNFDEKINYIENLIIKFYSQKENDVLRDCSNKGKPWIDEELMIILFEAPTKANCMKFARIFKRGYGSIEQIYRWASTPKNELGERESDSFIQQIKRVAGKVGFRAQDFVQKCWDY